MGVANSSRAAIQTTPPQRNALHCAREPSLPSGVSDSSKPHSCGILVPDSRCGKTPADMITASPSFPMRLLTLSLAASAALSATLVPALADGLDRVNILEENDSLYF